MALILSWQREEANRLTPQELCPCPHEESRDSHKMRNKGDRILISSSCIFSKTVIGWHRQPSN